MLRSTTTRLFVAALVSVAVQLGTVAVARAQASPDCAAKCIPIYEKQMSALIACATKALKKAEPVDPDCVFKVAAKTQKVWGQKLQAACADQTCSTSYPTANSACSARVSGSNSEDEISVFGSAASPPDGLTFNSFIFLPIGCSGF